MSDWPGRWFTKQELACKCKDSRCDRKDGPYLEELAALLDTVREKYRKPMPVHSGARCLYHEEERDKPKNSKHAHTFLHGCDVGVRTSAEAQELTAAALECGFGGIGWCLWRAGKNGRSKWVHIDARWGEPGSDTAVGGGRASWVY